MAKFGLSAGEKVCILFETKETRSRAMGADGKEDAYDCLYPDDPSAAR